MDHFARIASLLVLSLFSVPLPCLAEKNILTKNYDAKTFIKVDSMFGEHLKSGYHPYQVTIRNGKARPITWTLSVDFNDSSASSRTKSVFRIEVQPGEEAIEQILIPAPSTRHHRYSSYRHFRMTITAPGLENTSRGDSVSVDGSWPSLGISKKLAQGNISRLASKKQSLKKGQEYFANAYRELPADWRGLTCLDLLMIDESTWQALPKQQKRAVMTWVRFGGKVDLFTTKSDATFESLGIEEPDLNSTRNTGKYTLGLITINEWDGKHLPDRLVNHYGSLDQFEDTLHDEFDKSWAMVSEFGTKSFNPALVFILLIIFAVLVGPVNLFHFAKAGRRHRLFVTTPIISLVASLIIIFIILVQDGMGGKGRRIAFVDVQSNPDGRQLQITQHQISRTGVMLRSGFKNENQPVVSPVKLAPSRWNPLSNNRSQSEYKFAGDSYEGDLFRSRSEQGFHLREVRPSRSRIEIRQGGGVDSPVLFSSLEFPIKEFFYVDEKGIVWETATPQTITPGQEIQLVKTDLNDLSSWLTSSSKSLAATDRNRIRGLRSQRNRYFAIADDPSKLMIDSHSAIRWNDDLAIVSGMAVQP